MAHECDEGAQHRRHQLREHVALLWRQARERCRMNEWRAHTDLLKHHRTAEGRLAEEVRVAQLCSRLGRMAGVREFLVTFSHRRHERAERRQRLARTCATFAASAASSASVCLGSPAIEARSRSTGSRTCAPGGRGRQAHWIEAPAHSRGVARTRLGLENRQVSRERCPSLVAPLDEREREGELAQHPPKLFTASRERVASIHVARRCLQCSGRLRVKRQDLAVHSTDERPQEYIVDTDREIHDRLLDRDDAKLWFAGKSRRLAAGLCEGLRAPHTPRQTCAVWRCRAPPETAVAVPSA